MTQLTKGFSLKSFMTLFMLALVQTALWAQDESSGGSSSASSGSSTTTKSISVSSESNGWYTSPWVWVVGAAVFILLLVALMRGGGSDSTVATHTDRVTVTKSSSTDV